MEMYYFDYVATTPVDPEVLKVYNDVTNKYFMNVQSDPKASELSNQAKSKVLELLKIKEGYEVVFTSGGTEANNIAILGKFKNILDQKHFITSAIEHPSVLETFYELERLGHKVDFVMPNEKGIVTKEAVVSKIQNNTALVSIMCINNELGTCQPINEIFKEVKKINQNIITMVDYVQALGKVQINFEHVDIGTFSAHKIYATKGVGLLIKKKKIVMEQIIYGSKTSIRPGTQSLGAQVSFVNALKKAINNTKENYSVLKQHQDYFLKNIGGLQIQKNGGASIGVLSLTLPIKAQAQTVVEYLYNKNIIISTKSSCAQKLNKPSHVLKAINLTTEQINRTIRISFSINTTKEEIDFLVKNLKDIVKNF